MTSRLGLAMVGLALVSLLVSSGGVSSVAVERPVEVAIADDESEQSVAFNSTQNGSVVTVTNRLPEPLSVEAATVADSGANDQASNVTVDPPDDAVGADETGSIDVSGASCNATASVPIEIRATTGSTTIETTVNACNES
ncbi:hypothetical protein [Natrinema sp. HArc-T2]|uniref:hypothetical protein n=1 Tax=Natrinema sp. HArc-T2 TaxID=3242701 RepID=UPI00359D591F